jgi:hypothetical protein
MKRSGGGVPRLFQAWVGHVYEWDWVVINRRCLVWANRPSAVTFVLMFLCVMQ